MTDFISYINLKDNRWEFHKCIEKYAKNMAQQIPIFNHYSVLNDKFIREIIVILNTSQYNDKDKLSMIISHIYTSTISDIDKKISTSKPSFDTPFDTHIDTPTDTPTDTPIDTPIEKLVEISKKESIKLFNDFYVSSPINKIQEDVSKILEFISKQLVDQSILFINKEKSVLYDIKRTILSQSTCKDLSDEKILRYIGYICLNNSSFSKS
jgi:hypothetical protein